MRILVVRLSSIGDVTLSASVLPMLAERHPGARIDLVTGAPCDQLFSEDPRVNAVYRYDPSNGTLDRAGGGWDRIIDLQNNRRSARLIRAIAPGTPTTRFAKRHFERALLMLTRVNLYRPNDTVIARYLRAAGCPPGLESRYSARIIVQPSWHTQLDSTVAIGREAPILGLIPFAAWRNKAWPTERYAQVGKHFADQGWRVLIFGGTEDAQGALELAQRIGNRATSLAGKLPLRLSAAALSRCRVAAGGDTGILHLARAVGVRAVAVYGATSWHFGFFPSGEPPFEVLEQSLFCRPCHAHGGNWCWRGGRPCLARTSAASMISALERLAP